MPYLQSNSALTLYQLMEEYSVYGSEEEADDPRDGETDEDLTDEERDSREVVIPPCRRSTVSVAVLCLVAFTAHNTQKCYQILAD
jgi:hypothetical protein